MPVSGYVNYHVHSPEQQAYQIDAGGVSGAIVAPRLVKTEIALTDLRKQSSKAPSFTTDGIEFAQWSGSTSVDSSDDWQTAYSDELIAFFKAKLNAREVIVFDHTRRVDALDAVRKPARNVHSDYSKDGAEQRLEDLLGPTKAAEWRQSHYAFVNVWRPVADPINSSPLAFIRPDSVSTDDWVNIALIYPDRRGHILGLVANPAHDWIYKSKMAPNEIVYFNIYDNNGLPSIAHSAVDRTEDSNLNTVRQSIETRMLIRY